MGLYPIGTIGLGILSENSLNLIPCPPQNKTTFIDHCVLRRAIQAQQSHWKSSIQQWSVSMTENQAYDDRNHYSYFSGDCQRSLWRVYCQFRNWHYKLSPPFLYVREMFHDFRL